MIEKLVIIIGAGGHAKVIADIIEKSGDKLIGFLDDNLKIGTKIINDREYEVIGNIDSCYEFEKNNPKIQFIIGIGNNYTRKNIVEKRCSNLKFYTAIHPCAIIGMDVNIGEGTVIMPNVCINSSSKIGKHCIINTASIIEHDNTIDNFVHISPNASLGGTVKIHECAHVGIGSIIKNNIEVNEECIIGAGAVVVKNIDEKGTYIGVPAKKIKLY